MSKRALRRHHKQRLLNKMVEQNYYGLANNLGKSCRINQNGSWIIFSASGDEIYSKHHIRASYKRSVDQRSCSCPICGNPRRHYNEITLQEKKSNLKFQEELREQLCR